MIMASLRFAVVSLLIFATFHLLEANETGNLNPPPAPSSSFSSTLEALQTKIGYTFTQVGFLRQAMTHASFSQENNKALSVLGSEIIKTTVCLLSLLEDIDTSSKELNRQILEISTVETSCAADGMRLDLHKVIRVSPKTDPSMPVVMCGAFRALFGAIAVDTGKADVAGNIFRRVRDGELGTAMVV